MDESAKKQILNGMMDFSQSIRFRTSDQPYELVNAAIHDNPKIAYYLHWYTVVGVLGNYELRAQYIHKDTALSEIHTVWTKDECINTMCQFVGGFKKQLIVVAKQSVGLSNVTAEFHERHASFYPNLTRVGAKSYHSKADYEVYEFSFEYRIGQVKLNMMEQEVDNEVKRISKLLFLPSMPVEVKIYLAHNYLASTVTYMDNDDNSLDVSYTQSAYGALIKKQCVCQGYAEAFKRLMDAAGIECDVIYGKCIGSTTLHAWNIVSLGKSDSYYHIDVTWDSSAGHPGYMYFCKPDSFFAGKREWNKKYNHACSGRYAVLSLARKYVFQNKKILKNHGIDDRILDC